MGIDTHSLHLLRHARSEYGALGRTITLGRLANFLGPRATRKWFGAEATRGGYCETMLQQRFGATCVDSLDNSEYEGATIVADMNHPIPETLIGQYDSVLDFGCTEHIFDAAQSLRNIAAMCATGGMILHCVPANGFCGHGFYQFSPELFFSCYSEQNGFAQTEIYLAELADINHWYRVSPPEQGHRVNAAARGEMYVVAMTRKMAARYVSMQQSDYQYIWDNPNSSTVQTNHRGRLAGFREILSSRPTVARWLNAIDAKLTPGGTKILGKHPALTRIPTATL